MKLFFSSLVAVAFAAAGPVVRAQDSLPPRPPLVSTSGTAEIRVIPDLADLSFEVEVRNVDLAVARKQQAQQMVKVLAALRAAGIAPAELQTSQVQISPNYTERREETEKLRFYSVSQSIGCTLHELKKIPDVTTDAVSAGATGVGSAVLRTSQLRKYRDEARTGAIRAAKQKAVALATELGVKIGKPYTIVEGYDWRSNYNGNSLVQAPGGIAGGPGDATSPTFAPGTISVTASINVSFRLE